MPSEVLLLVFFVGRGNVVVGHYGLNVEIIFVFFVEYFVEVLGSYLHCVLFTFFWVARHQWVDGVVPDVVKCLDV